ncbi:MAG: hypothetical protein II930_02765 [Lachnospiraceae bacterium]|nr:hypothetical protein [Lachnospiraceae bacterium]
MIFMAENCEKKNDLLNTGLEHKMKRIAHLIALILISLIAFTGCGEVRMQKQFDTIVFSYEKEHPLTVSFPKMQGERPVYWELDRNYVFSGPIRQNGSRTVFCSGGQEDIFRLTHLLEEGDFGEVRTSPMEDEFDEIHRAWKEDVKETYFLQQLKAWALQYPDCVSVSWEGFIRLKPDPEKDQMLRIEFVSEDAKQLILFCHAKEEDVWKEQITGIFPEREVILTYPDTAQIKSAERDTDVPEMKRQGKSIRVKTTVTDGEKGFTAFVCESQEKEDIYLSPPAILHKTNEGWKWVEDSPFRAYGLTDRKVPADGCYYEILYFEFFQMQRPGDYRVLLKDQKNQLYWYDFSLK